MNYTTFVTTKYVQITHNKNIRINCVLKHAMYKHVII